MEIGAIEAAVEAPFLPYLKTIKLVLIVLSYLLALWAGWHWGEKLKQAEWDKAKLAQQQVVMDEFKRTEKASYDAGVSYEVKKRVILKKLTTPDRKLDATLQTPAGDVVIPGDLGMRLNELAGAEPASAPASQPALPLFGAHPLSGLGREPSDLGSDPGSEHSERR